MAAELGAVLVVVVAALVEVVEGEEEEEEGVVLVQVVHHRLRVRIGNDTPIKAKTMSATVAHRKANHLVSG